MTTSNFSTATTGWIAIATGVSAILAVIFLTLMATVNQSFGKVNDVFNSVIGISSAVLAWMLYAEHQAKSPLMSQIGLALATVGQSFPFSGRVLFFLASQTLFWLGGIQGSGTL